MKDVSTRAPGGQGFCDVYHVFRMDWKLNTINSESALLWFPSPHLPTAAAASVPASALR